MIMNYLRCRLNATITEGRFSGLFLSDEIIHNCKEELEISKSFYLQVGFFLKRRFIDLKKNESSI